MPETTEKMGLEQSLTAVNNAHINAVEGSHALTATKTQAYQSSHGDRNNINAERTMSNDEINRNLQNQGAIFAQQRQQNGALDYDADMRFEKQFMRMRAMETAFSVDTVEAAGIRQIQDSNKSNEILDKMAQSAAGGKLTKAELAMMPESGIQHAVATFNGLSDQNRVNTASETANTAMKLALAAVTQRQFERPAS